MALQKLSVENRDLCNGNKWLCRRCQLKTELCAMETNGFADVVS